jgi:hypothetical protein
MKWLTYLWWNYLITGRCYPKDKPVIGWRQFWCRLRGHPCGPIWYNPGGLEPDMSCKNCGDQL